MVELEKLKNEYEKERQNLETLHQTLEVLKQDDSVKKYIALQESESNLFEKCNRLYREVKNKEFSSCSHIWIVTSIEIDRYEGRSYRHYGCIKCGLSEEISKFYEWGYERGRELHLSNIPIEHRVICDFLNEYPSVLLSGTHLNLQCNFNLARAICIKLKQKYPNIDDETLIKYLKKALKDISEIEINEERQQSRARRLALNEKFSKWKTITLKS